MNPRARSSSSVRKKLIEVALPLEAINEASVREKSVRHGPPSTLHAAPVVGDAIIGDRLD